MNKRQLIDEIVSLNPTAEPGFLARFDDGDLRLYLQHLREAQRPRLTVSTGRYNKYFRDVRPQVEPQRPAARPAASSTWRVEPARQGIHVGQAASAAGSLASGLPPVPCQPGPKDAAAEVELDHLADEDLDLAIRKAEEVAQAAPEAAPVAVETQDARMRQDQVEDVQAADESGGEEVTAQEKAALAWPGQDLDEPSSDIADQLEDDLDEQVAEFDQPDEDAEPFVTVLPVPADAIQAVEQVLSASQRLLPMNEPAQGELDEDEPEAAGNADKQPASQAQDLISALEAEPDEPEPSLPSRARRIRKEESDAWLF